MVAPPFFSNHVETSPEQELENNLPTDGGSRDPKHKKPPLAIKPALNKPPLSQPTIPKRGSSSFSFRFPSWDVAAFTLPLFPELGQGFQQAGNQLPPTPTNRPFIIFPETNKIGITKPSNPTFKPKGKVENANIKPFISFGKPTKSVMRKTTTKSSKLWSALPPHLPKSTTRPPTPKESTTHAAFLSPKVKRVKMPKKKVKPFVFLGGSKQTSSKQPQSNVPKKKPSIIYTKKVNPKKSASKTTKSSIIYFQKVSTTQMPKPPNKSFEKVKTTQAPLKIFNVNNPTSSQNRTFQRPFRYKLSTTSIPHRKEPTPKGTESTTVISTQKESTTVPHLKPNTVPTIKTKLVTEPFFPNTSSNQNKPETEDKSEKLKVTTDNSGEIDEKKSLSLLVSALGVPDIWDMLLFGRFTRVQSQNIHQAGIVDMEPLQ